MTGADPETLDFTAATPAAVVEVMSELVPRAGWLTLEPLLEYLDPRPTGGMFGLLSGRGPAVPQCAWVPGERSRQAGDHVAVGIEHDSGPKAARRLAESGAAVPDGWVVLQDHPRRGLVVAVPPTEAHDRVLIWLLEAAGSLSSVPLGDTWRATVHRRS